MQKVPYCKPENGPLVNTK